MNFLASRKYMIFLFFSCFLLLPIESSAQTPQKTLTDLGNQANALYQRELTNIQSSYQQSQDALSAYKGLLTNSTVNALSGFLTSSAEKNIPNQSAISTPLCGVVVSPQSTPTSLTRNLKQGSTGPDVILLQKILNLSPFTQIAKSGDGSPGKETSAFGLLTKKAVIRFQEQNFKEILIPAGLNTGTGIVGALTRKVLNRIWLSSNPIATSTAPGILSIDPTSGGIGTIVTLQGINFAPDNTICGGKYSFGQSKSPDGKTLSFTVMDVGDTGPISIKVQNKDGESNLANFNFSNVVSTALSPVILSLDPATSTAGTLVTIHGTGFSKISNTINTGTKTISAASPDGTTLQFTSEAFTGDPTFTQWLATYSQSAPTFQYPITVQNDAGMSNTVYFSLKF